MDKVPRIIRQRNDYLDLRVPSQSRPGHLQQIQYWEDGNHNCECPRYQWAVKTKKFTRRCRHWRMTTIEPGDMPVTRLKRAIRAVKQNARTPRKIWKMLRCLNPQKYRLGVRCSSCELYPEYCNVHPIRYSRRGTRKPMIWKIQTALYNGQKRKAQAMMMKLLKRVDKLHPDGEIYERK